MNGSRVLAVCEFRRACRRPATWFVLATGNALLALHYLLLIIRYLEHEPLLRESGVTNEILARYFITADLSLVIAMPLLTMNVFAGERENGLLRWLYSAPLGSTELVLGKLLAVLGLGLAYVVLIAVAPLTLYWGAAIDGGVYASNLLGCALFMLLHACLGVLASALARAPSRPPCSGSVPASCCGSSTGRVASTAKPTCSAPGRRCPACAASYWAW